MRAVRGSDLRQGLGLVGGMKGDVLRGVPILGEQDVRETAGESVDAGEDFVAPGYGEVPAGHEVGLEIDEEKGIGLGVEGHCSNSVMGT